jgi:hypothetical protein
VTDWGGEADERIGRVLSDLHWLTDPSRGSESCMSFGERKVIGATADLLREIRARRKQSS